ncbi:MAG: putative sporulation protein YtxC [Peptococcaceae bacterium]|jgi:putative sporulation protein YtxC|nr:putative sporulation protein YtxC [Peptococcaceae bacterium]
MSNGISIGIAKHTDAFRDTLGQNLRLLENNGVRIFVREKPNGRYVVFSCSGGTGSQADAAAGAKPLVLRTLAAAIADLIVSRWEKVMLFNVIKNEYASLKQEEIETIYKLALGRMAGLDDEAGQLHPGRRKHRIQASLEEFLRSSDHINVDGFVVFRLKEYLADLRWVAGRAVDDFLLEQEYRDFVNLLRFFLHHQEQRAALVHVLVKPPGHFQLYDNDFRPVSYQYLEGFIVDISHREIDYEDMLISALITLAPGRVVLHSPGPAKLTAHTLGTLRAVFEDQVGECRGCQFCGGPECAGR